MELIFCQKYIYFCYPSLWTLTTRIAIIYTFLSHWFFYNYEHPKKGKFQFCFPGLLGIHRNPKWKEFLKSRESFLKKVPICTLTDLNTGFGGPWNKLQIILVNGTFIMPQKKTFGQKKFWISYTGSKVPFWQFFHSAKMALLNALHVRNSGRNQSESFPAFVDKSYKKYFWKKTWLEKNVSLKLRRQMKQEVERNLCWWGKDWIKYFGAWVGAFQTFNEAR